MDWKWRRAAFFFVSFLSTTTIIQAINRLPEIIEPPTEPTSINSGDEAILRCSIKNLGNFTVIWKRIKFGRADVLSANDIKVTNDPRISVSHDEDGDRWILTISRTRTSDTAQYICEVNSIPAIQVSNLLTVAGPATFGSTPFSLIHNYTECCTEKGVSRACLGFCSLRNIVQGTTGATPLACQEHLPVIAGCMADGRNHTPCCVREQIPEVCRDVCVGKFGLINETIVNHYTCSRYSRATLACIAEGIEILPGQPRDVHVEPISDKELKVSWQQPKQATITHYIVNVTELGTFDEIGGAETNSTGFYNWDDANQTTFRHGRMHEGMEKVMEIKVNASENSTMLTDLKPFTMYEIYLTSVNSYGRSLPTYRLRTLTLMPTPLPSAEIHPEDVDQPDWEHNHNSTAADNDSLPELPDIRGCCSEKGVAGERCLDLFCDPVQADLTNLTDMMICAPWISASIQCLTGGMDHSPCCRQRGLPELCIPLCYGNITRIDFRFFRCLPFMSIYTNCLMQGYGVLTTPPQDLIVKALHTDWAVLKWRAPEKFTSSVIGYNVHYRSLTDDQVIYSVVGQTQSPFLLDHLQPNSDYEAFVAAVNQYGSSEGSLRVLFHTPSKVVEEEAAVQHEDAGYNLTVCCERSGLNASCMPLCSYRARMSDLQRLAPLCLPELHKLLKCGAGGRNHVPCCTRRRVNVNCTPLCAGIVSPFTSATSAICVPYVPHIITCMEEGSTLLPGPIRELHAEDVNSTAVTLNWAPPLDRNVSLYEVHYQGEFSNTPTTRDKAASQIDESVNVTGTAVTISTLQPEGLYSFYVVAWNEYGSSLPSSILSFNTSSYEDAKAMNGVVSQPHSLAITMKNTTSLLVSWLPPDFSHPSDAIIYTVYHKMKNETQFSNFTTTMLLTLLMDLKPNTEYAIYVTASTEKGESSPSEMLQAWTEPAFPAFVEMPRIHPSTQIEEGGNLTILCVAAGTPIPMVGVYIDGRRIHEEMTRHMVTRIFNVSRFVESVTCEANNGYGMGSQATKAIQISYGPNLEARLDVTVAEGHRAILECVGNGYPEPHMTWSRDRARQIPVVPGGRYLSRVLQEENGDTVAQLIIGQVTMVDQGVYYCNSQNPFGSKTEKINLHVEAGVPISLQNVTACCRKQNVMPECLDACAFDVDLTAVIERPQCLSELSKLMLCAADGSDHRRCCQTWGVPKRCIGWCQGKHVPSAPLCVLAYSKQIVTCFQEGKDILPGPPEIVEIAQLTETSVVVKWEPPTKNPHTVQFYRVYWKSLSRANPGKFQNDTHTLSMVVSDLNPGIEYEFAVKAANHHGSSLQSNLMRYSITGNSVSEANTQSSSSNSAPIAIGVILSLMVIAIAVVAFFYYKRRYRPRLLGGVSFENPSYMRETGDTSQVPNTHDHTNGVVNATDVGWKSEALQPPAENVDVLYDVPIDDRTGLHKARIVF